MNDVIDLTARLAAARKQVTPASTRAVDPLVLESPEALVERLQSAPPRPQICVDPTERERVVNEAEHALAQLKNVYVRARGLVHVVRDPQSPDWLRRPEGQPLIVSIEEERLAELLGVAADWLMYSPSKEKWCRSSPPTWVVKTLLARGQWTLPPLEGLTDVPVMRADGSILDVPGYDPATRLIYDPGDVSYPAVPTSPTHEDARSAVAALLDPFAEFPFVADADCAGVAALILSIVGRAAIDGPVPMFLVGAPTPGSGKGLLVDAATIVATGRKSPKIVNTQDDDETRKRLLALALESPTTICIDNVEGSIGSAALASALTDGQVTDRVLGASRNATASLRAVWTATGNNVRLRGDLGRRVVSIGLDPRTEHPEDRNFTRGDLLAHVREQRASLLAAALTLLRAYVVAGRPSHGRPRKGSFEAWDALVRGAVIWALDADPLGAQDRVREQGDEDLDNLRTMLAAWHENFGDRSVVLADVVGKTIASEPLREALGPYADRSGRIEAASLGYALRRVKDRVAGGLVLRSGPKSKRGTTWSVVSA